MYGKRQIAKSFRVDDKWFHGAVFANRHGVCCVAKKIRGRAVTPRNSAVYSGSLILGVFAPAAVYAVMHQFDANRDLPDKIIEVDLKEARGALEEHFSGLYRVRAKERTQVIFIPREMIRSWKTSIWAGLKLNAADIPVALEIHPWKLHRVKRFLVDEWGE